MNDTDTQTKQDAFLRVLNAKIGSLAGGPTMKYMQELRNQLYVWVGEVEERMALDMKYTETENRKLMK